MQTIHHDPLAEPQAAAVEGADVRSRTPLTDRFASRRLAERDAQSCANGAFPLLARDHKEPVRYSETWSVGTRSDRIRVATTCFVIGVGSLPIALMLNPGLLFMWLFVGPLLVIAAIQSLAHPYELLIFPSGRLRFISVRKAVEFDSADVRRVACEVNRSNRALRSFTLYHPDGSATMHGARAAAPYERLLNLPTLPPAVQVSVEEYDDSD